MIFIRNNVKQKVKFSITIIAIAMVIAFAIFTVMKYEVEGEKEVPFQVGKIFVISSASTVDETEVGGEETNQNEQTDNTSDEQNAQNTSEEQGEASQEETTEQQGKIADSQENNEQQENQETEVADENYIWNERVIQTNDVYIYLDKNDKFKEEQIIKSVKIDNIKILEKAKIGKIQVYMPSSFEDSQYKYTNDFLVNSSLSYRGAEVDNKKNLEISYNGGGVYISFANMGLDNFKSNEAQEIQQGGLLLEKMNLSDEDLKFKVSFDLIIEVQDKSYITNIVLDMPASGLIGNEQSYQEITDFDKLVFKRM